jgi:prolyl-tRNA editing enzyme YbaK/EbsC (Cys-tRNA(Pro) deacylase)
MDQTIAHKQKKETFINQDLLRLKEVWAAGGTPREVFNLDPTTFADWTGEKMVAIQ